MASDNLEVELKYLGPDLHAVRAALERAGARLVSPRRIERNVVFDDDEGSLGAAHKLLRLRDDVELTVKIPVEDTRFKSRRELTVRVGEGDTSALLEGLGFLPRWRYEKWREGWDLDGMYITLDELPFLGAVVEIEGERERIDATAAAIGLDGVPTSTANYRALFLEHAAKRGMPPGDLTFEAEAAAG